MSLNPVVPEDTDTTVDTLTTATLDRAVNATIETNILNPVTHDYDYTTGGQTTFRFPASGVLDAPNCSLTFNPTSADDKACFPLSSGGQSMIDRITLRVGGVIMSQIINSGEYSTMKELHQSLGYQASVCDQRHLSSNKFMEYIRPDLDSTKENCGAILNPENDQVSSWHQAKPATTNVVQETKCLTSDKKTTAEVVLRMGDLFPVFKDNKLPLFAMAQVELQIEWLAANSIANNPKSCVISKDQTDLTNGNIGLAADQVRLNVDYIHYDDEEKAKIQNQINNGLRLRFTEVLLTKGINPEAAGDGEESTSSHIIGMAGKEVQAIYVKKLFDTASTTGQSEKAELGHDNAYLNQFRSQNIRSEKYNWIINNFRVYSQDVSNYAEQHQYVGMISGNAFQPVPASYDTMNYNANFKNILLDKVLDGGAASAKTQTAWLGTAHYIGLNMKKFSDMGARFQNATRIGTSPIEFVYTRKGATNNLAQVDLTFFIEYSRTLEITPLGVNVMDS
jgi:hypothetical protein